MNEAEIERDEQIKQLVKAKVIPAKFLPLKYFWNFQEKHYLLIGFSEPMGVTVSLITVC